MFRRSPGTTYHEPLTHSIPKLKPLNIVSCCSSCGITFRLFRLKYNCYNCGNVTCGRCSSNRTEIPKFGYFEPVRICDLCYEHLKIMRMNRSQLIRLPIKTLREYISAYNLPCYNIIEKDDLANVILAHIPLEERYEVYYRDHYPVSHTETGETASDIHQNEQSVRIETQNNTDNSRSRSRPPPPTPQRQQPPPQRQQPPPQRQQSPPQRQQPPSQRQQPPPQHQQPPPQRQQRQQRQQNFKPPQNPSNTSPISLQTIIRDKVDISKLSIKTLKEILKENCVDYSKMVEKSELVERMEILIKWAKHEMSSKTSEISDDGLCRVCCDAQSNCLFMDCGHMCTCLDCGKKLQETKNECPICRETIIKIIRVFRA